MPTLTELFHQLMALGLEKVFFVFVGPIFILSMAAESIYLHWRQAQTYSVSYTAINISLALSHAVMDALAWIGLVFVFDWLHQYRLFDIPVTLWSMLGLLILQDFLYYWFHRASHRIRWMWASHVTHHSGEVMNLSTALRQSPTYHLSGMWVFWLPLAVLGFSTSHIVLSVAVSLAYQFFVHTESVRQLPAWVEAIFNTPSHHRVHHGRNPQYLDRNYAGILIIWDKLFGTFVPETIPCDYGIIGQIHTRNPLVMMFHEWGNLWRDVRRPGPLGLRLRHLWKPPGWQRDGTVPLHPASPPADASLQDGR